MGKWESFSVRGGGWGGFYWGPGEGRGREWGGMEGILGLT